MFDRQIGLTGIYPHKAAPKPATGEARVERQRSVDEPDHCTNIFAELSQRESGIGEDARVVLRRFERLPGEIDALAAVRLWLFGPAVADEPQVADRRPRQCRPVARIDRDCLLNQFQSRNEPLFSYRI